MEEAQLKQLYTVNKLSVRKIAVLTRCSENRVTYWMDKYGISRRSASEATYLHHNPNGDPFTLRNVSTKNLSYIYGMGIGLYWGEGTKADKYSVRLGNSDPNLLLAFMLFLKSIYGVDSSSLRFSLQLFTDIDEKSAMLYWCEKLNVSASQFYKTHITISGSIGNYRVKSKYGVVTMYYHNKKLRDILVGLLPT